MTIETEISADTRELARAARTPVHGESPEEVKQRAEGEFLRKVVEHLQPMLCLSMRSHRIFLASDMYGRVELESDGTFVHIGIADQQDSMDPLQVVRAEPSLTTILKRIEAELVSANDARATKAADIVRLARDSLKTLQARRGDA